MRVSGRILVVEEEAIFIVDEVECTVDDFREASCSRDWCVRMVRAAAGGVTVTFHR